MTTSASTTAPTTPASVQDSISVWDLAPDMVYSDARVSYYFTGYPKRTNIDGTNMEDSKRYNVRLVGIEGKPASNLRPATPAEKDKFNPEADINIRQGSPIRINDADFRKQVKLTAKQVLVVTTGLKNGIYLASPLGGSDKGVYYRVPHSYATLANDVLEAFGK